MMTNLPPIIEWKRVFIDTSFIIDSLRQSKPKDGDPKSLAIRNTHRLLDHFIQSAQVVTWVTSSIVLAELLKFENRDAVLELQKLFNSPEVEIINFTRREASFLVNDISDYLEVKHISRFIREMKQVLAEDGVFNPKNYISNDALIVACAKSKRCDVVITSDERSFLQIAKRVDLPVLLSKDIPLDMYGNVDYHSAFSVRY